MKKVFFDMEFTGLHQKTTLISLGAVSEDGHTFYAELYDYDKTQVDSWLEENVISHLHVTPQTAKGLDNIEMCDNLNQVTIQFTQWLRRIGQVEMWSDCLAYDWVLFNSMYGDALSIPKNVYYIPFDICTLMKVKGVDPDINREEYVYGKAAHMVAEHKHNALHDALVIKKCYEKLME